MDIQRGSEMLLKGGSLLGSSCDLCGGVLIKFQNSIYCMNCNNKSTSTSSINPNRENNHSMSKTKSDKVSLNNSDLPQEIDFSKQKQIILEQISLLINSLQFEKDLLVQKNKLDLIKLYLEILNNINIFIK